MEILKSTCFVKFRCSELHRSASPARRAVHPMKPGGETSMGAALNACRTARVISGRKEA